MHALAWQPRMATCPHERGDDAGAALVPQSSERVGSDVGRRVCKQIGRMTVTRFISDGVLHAAPEHVSRGPYFPPGNERNIRQQKIEENEEEVGSHRTHTHTRSRPSSFAVDVLVTCVRTDRLLLIPAVCVCSGRVGRAYAYR
jgi:hypothetical protein